jgi:hypothetical protein
MDFRYVQKNYAIGPEMRQLQPTINIRLCNTPNFLTSFTLNTGISGPHHHQGWRILSTFSGKRISTIGSPLIEALTNKQSFVFNSSASKIT